MAKHHTSQKRVSEFPVGKVRTVGGYPDESEHTIEWLCKHKDLKDGDLLYTAPQREDQQPAPDVARPAIFSDEDHVYAPRGLIAAACSAINLGATSSKLLAELRRYTVGDLSNKPAPDMPGLTEALRQYQHNDGSGLVFGYDKILVDRHIAGLVEALELFVSNPIPTSEDFDKARAAIAAYRKQGSIAVAPDAALVEAFDAGQRAAQADAAVLAEALERCMTSMLDAGFNPRFTVITQGRKALAAHRKQEGEA